MRANKGPGTKVTPGEKRRYDQLRAAGWSPEASAASIHRSKSWAYLYEAEKRGPEPKSPQPKDNLSDAVSLVFAIVENPDDQEPAFEIFDRFGAAIVPSMAELVVYMAKVQAGDLQRSLRTMFDTEDELIAALHAEPITWQDVLRIIPDNVNRYRAGESLVDSWMPPRVRGWMSTLLERHPDLAELRDEAVAIADEDESGEGLAELRKRVSEGSDL
jgi:hypothetical protein